MSDRRRERGEATMEMTLIVPVLMTLLLLVIQFGLWYHANNVAEAAAQEGVRHARAADGSARDGQETAEAFLETNAPSVAATATVEATRSDATTRVAVTGTLNAIVPGLELPVRALAESPTERFRSDR
jgi:Flp pilus assembly protein TadG